MKKGKITLNWKKEKSNGKNQLVYHTLQDPYCLHQEKDAI